MPDTDVVVFIATKNTAPAYRRVLWRVSKHDARKICGDERTSGRRHMLCWTAHDIDDPSLNRYVPDTGSYAEVLADHHVVVLASHASRGGPDGEPPPGRSRRQRHHPTREE